MEVIAQFIVVIMGGGVIALIPVIQKWIKQSREGRLIKEDTAINRWKELATEKRQDAEKSHESLTAYRRWYHRLWTRYVLITEDECTYPLDPEEHERKLREGKDDNRSRKEPPEAE